MVNVFSMLEIALDAAIPTAPSAVRAGTAGTTVFAAANVTALTSATVSRKATRTVIGDGVKVEVSELGELGSGFG